MTKEALDALLLGFTGPEYQRYVAYQDQVPKGDIVAKQRYIAYVDANRPDMGVPELYYNEWDNPEADVDSMTEKKKLADKYKRLHSINAEKEGLKKWLVIQKYARFGTVFDHSHSFIEINYMYSGSCTNIVDGCSIQMEAGDFIIMKPGSVHRIVWADENDLLMNIILLPYAAGTILDKTLVGASDLSAFMVEAIYGQTSRFSHLFLQTRGVEPIQTAMTNLMCDYYDNMQDTAEITVGTYLQLVFALLWKESMLYPQKAIYSNKPNVLVSQIVSHIQQYCMDCTRESVAAHFGYSTSRISSLLAEHIGKSFIALRNEFRMEYAEKRLLNSTLPVKKIAEECGFANVTQFYKTYREHFGRFPRK